MMTSRAARGQRRINVADQHQIRRACRESVHLGSGRRGGPVRARRHCILEFADETLALYRDGRQRGLLTGWPSVDELMTIRPGELSVITGIPNHGKSEFVDALMVNIAERYGWSFAVCSFENRPTKHQRDQCAIAAHCWSAAP